jgi:hypothetical protein
MNEFFAAAAVAAAAMEEGRNCFGDEGFGRVRVQRVWQFATFKLRAFLEHIF